MFESISEQFVNILIVFGFLVAILLVSSFLIYVVKYLSERELSDQLGWLNFKKSKIGLAFFVTGILSVCLVFLVLLIFIF